MQKKKIFIELQLDPKVGRRLSRITQKWSDLPVKWMREENLHLNITFIGYVDESVIGDICQKVSMTCQQLESFDIDMENIELSPDPENPQLIQLSGKPSCELKNLYEKIQQSLGIRGAKYNQFSPNITLGRIRKLMWQELKEKPEISEKFHVAMTVDHVSVMESKGGGAEYVCLENCYLI